MQDSFSALTKAYMALAAVNEQLREQITDLRFQVAQAPALDCTACPHHKSGQQRCCAAQPQPLSPAHPP